MLWNTIRVYNTRRFSVALQWSYDESPDLSWCDSATLAGLKRGDYNAYCFRVVVLCDGIELGADYLGESIYDDPAEFAREHYGIAPKGRADKCIYVCYFPGMLRNAIAQARTVINRAPRMRAPLPR